VANLDVFVRYFAMNAENMCAADRSPDPHPRVPFLFTPKETFTHNLRRVVHVNYKLFQEEFLMGKMDGFAESCGLIFRPITD
jgi:hypothetical protein